MSALSRARETFELIYPGSNCVESELLNERRFGVLEFMDAKETLANEDIRRKSRFEMDYVPENGESVNQFYGRVKRDFSRLLDIFMENNYSSVTIVGHGGYLRGICYVFNVDETLASIPFLVDNGKGVTLDVKRLKDYEYKIELVSLIGGISLEDIRCIRPKIKVK